MRPAAPWLLLALALLAGCGDATGGEGSSTGPPGPPASPASSTPAGPVPSPSPTPEPPAIVDVFDGTVAQAAPGGTGEAPFEVPGGYLELFVRAAGDGDVQAVGQVRLALAAPDGTEHPLLDGFYGQDDAGGVAAPGLTCPCEWRVPSAAGAWAFRWDVQGALSLPVRVSAQ